MHSFQMLSAASIYWPNKGIHCFLFCSSAPFKPLFGSKELMADLRDWRWGWRSDGWFGSIGFHQCLFRDENLMKGNTVKLSTLCFGFFCACVHVGQCNIRHHALLSIYARTLVLWNSPSLSHRETVNVVFVQVLNIWQIKLRFEKNLV